MIGDHSPGETILGFVLLIWGAPYAEDMTLEMDHLVARLFLAQVKYYEAIIYFKKYQEILKITEKY